MRWLLLATLAAVVGFLAFPYADLAVSALFYKLPKGFYLEWHPVLRNTYLAVRYVTRTYVVLLAIAGILRALRLWNFPWRSWCYLVLVLLVGPLLIVEEISKDYVHRPRPREVVEFGGSLDYVPPLAMGAQEGKSFVSSHAAAGFYVAAFAFLLQGRKRRNMYITGLALGGVIGAVRVMQGGHFVSDIVFAGLIMLWTIHLLAWIMLVKPRKE